MSHDVKVREVLFESGRRINMHCKTTIPELYVFTILMEYTKALFYLIHFLKSLENLSFKMVMKEIEDQVDKKM